MLRVAMNPRMFADQLKASNFRIWTTWALFEMKLLEDRPNASSVLDSKDFEVEFPLRAILDPRLDRVTAECVLWTGRSLRSERVEVELLCHYAEARPVLASPLCGTQRLYDLGSAFTEWLLAWLLVVHVNVWRMCGCPSGSPTTTGVGYTLPCLVYQPCTLR